MICVVFDDEMVMISLEKRRINCGAIFILF